MIKIREKAKYVKGSSLFYAIVLSMLIGLVMMALISLNYFQTVELESYTSTVELIDNCKSAEAILLSEHETVQENNWIRVWEIEDETYYKQKPWGIWNVGMVKSERRKEVITNEFIFGSRWNNKPLAIQLKNGISGLSISGRTRITGNVHVPGGRVKPAFIEGQSFNGARVVDGTVSETPRKFPKLSLKLRARMEALRTADFENDSLVNYSEAQDIELQDFAKTGLVLISTDSIAIIQKKFTGNIIIQSDRAIYISPFAELKNVICIAPRIYVGSGFKGSIQCVATQKILISENAELSYPSGLYIDSEKDKKVELVLEKGVRVEGAVILTKTSSDRIKKVLKIGTGAEVVGNVYCEAALELRGKVSGQVITHEFSLRTPSASYKNHLLNAEVNVKELPYWFSGLLIEGEKLGALKIQDL